MCQRMVRKLIEIYELKQNIYKEGSPILILNGGIFKSEEDNLTYATLSMKNITNETISSVTFDIHIFDLANNVIELIRDYTYEVPNLGRNGVIGENTHIPLSCENPHSLSVALKSVNFNEENIWFGSNSLLYATLPEFVMLEDEYENIEIAEQFKRDFTENFAFNKEISAKYVPYKYLDIWLCSCGEINNSEEEKCYSCGALYEPQKEYVDDPVQINTNKNEHFRLIAEKAERERLDKERREREAEEARLTAERLEEEERIRVEQHKKRVKMTKIISLSVSIPAVIALIIYLISLNTYLIPKENYDNAVKALANEEFDTAISQFLSLRDFEDSATMVIEATYQKGQNQIETGEYEEAIATFESISEEKNVTNVINEASYRIAIDLYDEKDYTTALDQFALLNGYSDSEEYIEECHFCLAKLYAQEYNLKKSLEHYMLLPDDKALDVETRYFDIGSQFYAEGEYEQSEPFFVSITDETLQNQVKELHYQRALTLIDSGNLEEASTLLTELSEYSDSLTQLNRIDYINAEKLFAEKDYEGAIELYEAAEGYSDSADKILQSKYQIAISVYNSRDYASASALFKELGDYENSVSMYEEATYSHGYSQYKSGNYLDAYNTLYPIKHHTEAFYLLVTRSEFYIYVYDVDKGPNPLNEQ